MFPDGYYGATYFGSYFAPVTPVVAAPEAAADSGVGGPSIARRGRVRRYSDLVEEQVKPVDPAPIMAVPRQKKSEPTDDDILIQVITKLFQ